MRVGVSDLLLPADDVLAALAEQPGSLGSEAGGFFLFLTGKSGGFLLLQPDETGIFFLLLAGDAQGGVLGRFPRFRGEPDPADYVDFSGHIAVAFPAQKFAGFQNAQDTM